MSSSKRAITLVAIACVIVAGIAFIVGRMATDATSADRAGSAAAGGVVRTDLPGLAPATGEPTLTSLDTVTSTPGTVVQAAGPFDDRFELEGMAFDGVTVTGSVVVTSDVSELIELEVIAGFYDGTGELLGSAIFVRAEEEHGSGPPELTTEFSIIAPPGLPGTPVSAAVGVPVLVNE